jgi:hypothetical protein
MTRKNLPAIGLAVAFSLVVGCGPEGDAPAQAEPGSLAALTFSGQPVVGAQSGRCWDLASSTTTAGTQVQLYTCSGGANQAWTYDGSKRLTVYGNRCLDASGQGRTPGTKVIIWSCNGQTNQQWNVNADGTVVGVQSGLCVEAAGSGTANGTKLQLGTCSGGANQSWRVGSVATSYSLAISVSGSGSTTPTAGTYTYAPGTAVSVTATPATGSQFTGWSGAATGGANPITVVMDASKTLTASFAASGGTSDYPFCNYGAVPSATPPVWSDNPALTPFGFDIYGAPSTTVAGGYILISEGPQGPSQVPVATQQAILARINEDLKFETSSSHVHMPPWATGLTGTHYIDYIFAGTGLPRDPGTAGYQGWENGYPDVETNAVAMTDARQRYDLTHEFNHVLLNSYGTVNGSSVSWPHESFNNYLILLTAEHAAGATPGQSAQFTWPSNIGYLDALVYQQPYVPIESCGIKVSDGSAVNGPGEYMTDITGFRYNDLFPLFVAQRVGQRFFAAAWEQGTANEQILSRMTRLLDRSRVQCMVQEYAARLALGDFLEMSSSVQRVASARMYAATVVQNGWIVPSVASSLPRYTGRNNIPIAVSGGATTVSVNFAPDATGSKGTPSEMRAQIVYRATDGSSVFSTPVASGTTSIALAKPPRNGVVVVVVTNVTMSGYKAAKAYGWDPDETFGYRLQVTGGNPAPTGVKYF